MKTKTINELGHVEWRYKTIAPAIKKSKEIAKKFGFKPNVYEETSIFNKDKYFVVIQGKGMKRIDRL